MDNKDLLPEDDTENEYIEENIAELLQSIGLYENECLEKEINEDIEKCMILDIKIPEVMEYLMEFETELWRVKKKKFPIRKVVAAFLILMLFTSMMLVIDRENVIAFRRVINGIKSTFTEQSQDIRSQEISLPEYFPAIPDGFEKIQSQWNDTLMYFQYENTKGQFLKIAIYQTGYFVSFDNEDLELSENIVINGLQGKKLVKKGLTIFYIYYGQQMITVVSNLPESQVNDFAEGIKPLKERGIE